MENIQQIILPAEWYSQSGIMLTWPHKDTDWHDILDEVEECFVQIAFEISKREKLIIVCSQKEELEKKLSSLRTNNILYAELPANDTWARDHGPITVFVNGKPVIYDFAFNGWGMKFVADLDNQLTEKLYSLGFFSRNITYLNKHHFVLEGGSIESDGQGTLLTTSECLCAVNRNGHLSKNEIEKYLITEFGLKRVLWLNSGYLAGDDTDSHIDTLARFCNEETIAYVTCDDPLDEHYEALKKMEEELKSFKTLDNKPYHLVQLPMAEPVYEENQRLPATYANFLIVNDAVLFPLYNSPKDSVARKQLEKVFPGREIIGIDCRPLIKQHGSLHCVTMQLPEGVLE